MFKKDRTTNILFLCSILVVVVISCDGRISPREALKESIETFNEEVDIEVIQYVPEGLFESTVDTVLSTGYRVKVKTSTDAFDDVLVTRIKDSINYQTHYRKFVLDIELEKNAKVFFSKKFTRDLINKQLLESGVILNDFDNYVLYAHQLSYEDSNEQQIVLNLVYKIPESEETYAFHLILQPNGQIQLKPISL